MATTDQPTRMLTSIATVSVSGTLDRKLDVIAGAGFGGVEIFENDLLGFDGTAQDVGNLIRSFGLVCTCYQPFRDYEGLPPALRARALERAEAKFDVMQALGTDLLLVCSSVHPEASADYARIVDDFRLLGERAARRGLRIGYEALAWGSHVFDHRQAWEIVRTVDHPAIGIIVDSFHSLARKIPVDSIAAISGDKIFLAQIADAPEMPTGYLYWSRHFRCFPSQGEFPVAAYVAAITRTGYVGPLSLEIFNDRFREWSAARIAADGLRSLIVLQEQAATVHPMPPRVKIEGVEFIEFAAHADQVPRLAVLLSALGFAHVGEHRTKAVSLWRQDGTYLVINRDPHGWANDHWKLHGTSVCAVALRVASAANALERATLLNVDTYNQRPAEGELSIPWIRGVGGALTYFTERAGPAGDWTNDFLTVAPRSTGAAATLGVTKVDHLEHAMRVEELLSWQLHYVSLFDIVKSPTVEISDTLGLVQSQTIESIDGDFQVVLNATGATQTLAARFVQGGSGAGVQHIAFATTDIMLAARSARANELEILGVPPNYYDDLKARFALSAALLDELRRFDIFYDRNESGELFQFFTRAFEKRFFFEIVERRGYKGYSLINSAVRLAAQARYKNTRID